MPPLVKSSGMQLLYLLTQDLESPSGLGRYLPLAKEMAHRGHQVYIAALHPHLEAVDELQFVQEGVNVRYVAPMHVWKRDSTKGYFDWKRLLAVSAEATKRLTLAALKTGVDIIHICKPHPMNSLAGLAVSKLRRTRLLVDCDDFEAASGHFSAPWQKTLVSLFERWTPRFADIVTTNTEFMQMKLASWGVPEHRIIYLPNGVDQSRFEDPGEERVQALRRHLDLPGGKTVIYVGSLSRPSHRVDLLLDSFPLIRNAEPDCSLLLVGGGEELDELKARAEAQGMKAAIRFCGRVPPADISAYYRLADVSVEPLYDDDASRGRSPLKLFESWICGVPFVTADVGDRRRLIGKPEAAVLVAPGSRQALADGILRVLRDPKTAETLRRRGLEKAQAYTWDRLCHRLEAAYLQLF